MTGPWLPLQAGVGFSVRAERADGVQLTSLSDATGVARLPLDPAAGPWDLTIAKAAFTAVSIVGVTTPLTGAVYSESRPPWIRPGGELHALNGRVQPYDGHTIVGVSLAKHASDSDGAIMGPSGQFAYQFDAFPMAPALSLVAFDFSENLDCNPTGVSFLSLPRPLTDVFPVIHLPLPAPVVSDTIHFYVALPADGLINRANARSYCPGCSYSVANLRYLEQTRVDGGLVVGYACDVRDATGLQVMVSLYDGIPQPTNIDVDFLNEGPESGLHGWISAPMPPPARVEVGAVHAESVDGDSIDTLHFAIDADGYDGALLILGPGTPSIEPWDSWWIYTAPGAPLASLHVPHLPPGLHLADFEPTPRGNVSTTLALFVRGPDAPWSRPAELFDGLPVAIRTTPRLIDVGSR